MRLKSLKQTKIPTQKVVAHRHINSLVCYMNGKVDQTHVYK